MRGDIHLHLIWCAETRMIDEDGLSRGDLENGVMTGQTMLKFIPIHQGALERSSLLKEWLSSNLCLDMVFLETSDWFYWAHGKAPLFVWSPAVRPDTRTRTLGMW